MIKINLEAMAKQYAVYHPGMNARQQECTLELMKEACKRTLELAAKNAECRFKLKSECDISQLENGFVIGTNAVIINKQSILDTIKQIK